MVWRLYILDTFVASDITPHFLDLMREDLSVVKEARFTAVIRFMYTDEGVRLVSCWTIYELA